MDIKYKMDQIIQYVDLYSNEIVTGRIISITKVIECKGEENKDHIIYYVEISPSIIPVMVWQRNIISLTKD